VTVVVLEDDPELAAELEELAEFEALEELAVFEALEELAELELLEELAEFEALDELSDFGAQEVDEASLISFIDLDIFFIIFFNDFNLCSVTISVSDLVVD
jgi:hypothetical protein